jgi:hypothetical protein
MALCSVRHGPVLLEGGRATSCWFRRGREGGPCGRRRPPATRESDGTAAGDLNCGGRRRPGRCDGTAAGGGREARQGGRARLPAGGGVPRESRRPRIQTGRGFPKKNVIRWEGGRVYVLISLISSSNRWMGIGWL